MNSELKVFTFGSMKNSAKGVVLIFFMLFTSVTTTFAQQGDNETPPPADIPQPPPGHKGISADNFFFGGNIGLQFGTVTYFDISPRVGYNFTKKFAAGVGATYIYINDKRYKPSYSSDTYGGRVFGQYQVLENVQAYTEYEVLNMEVPDDLHPYRYIRTNVSSWLVGGGYVQGMGERSSAVILLLWNLTESRYSIYQNPVIRIGFNVGF